MMMNFCFTRTTLEEYQEKPHLSTDINDIDAQFCIKDVYVALSN